jgi:hypothetical protein
VLSELAVSDGFIGLLSNLQQVARKPTRKVADEIAIRSSRISRGSSVVDDGVE